MYYLRSRQILYIKEAMLCMSNLICKKLHISVSPHPRLLSTLSSLGCDQKQEAESSRKIQSPHSVYPTIPWFNELTQTYITNGDESNNFIPTREDSRDYAAASNKLCLEKKAPISFSVESIIGTK